MLTCDCSRFEIKLGLVREENEKYRSFFVVHNHDGKLEVE